MFKTQQQWSGDTVAFPQTLALIRLPDTEKIGLQTESRTDGLMDDRAMLLTSPDYGSELINRKKKGTQKNTKKLRFIIIGRHSLTTALD